MRRYVSPQADSARWESFEFRPGDVVISTPPKCGTTWMQNIVGMLLLNRVELGLPIDAISPWLDATSWTDEAVFDLLEQQRHRRFIKTHTPLDGIPRLDDVTYITMLRHPLDTALSHRDHRANSDRKRVMELRGQPVEERPAGTSTSAAPIDDPAKYLRSFIGRNPSREETGVYALADLAEQALTYWSERHAPNVRLFHYTDMWNDLDGEMRTVARLLDLPVTGAEFDRFVEAATLQSMRSRAADLAPGADLGVWKENEEFFKAGGTREWRSLLGTGDLATFDRRLEELARDAAPWVVGGRRFLD